MFTIWFDCLTITAVEEKETKQYKGHTPGCESVGKRDFVLFVAVSDKIVWVGCLWIKNTEI